MGTKSEGLGCEEREQMPGQAWEGRATKNLIHLPVRTGPGPCERALSEPDFLLA